MDLKKLFIQAVNKKVLRTDFTKRHLISQKHYIQTNKNHIMIFLYKYNFGWSNLAAPFPLYQSDAIKSANFRE